MVVGRRSFPTGKVTFQGRAVKLREGIWRGNWDRGLKITGKEYPKFDENTFFKWVAQPPTSEQKPQRHIGIHQNCWAVGVTFQLPKAQKNKQENAPQQETCIYSGYGLVINCPRF